MKIKKTIGIVILMLLLLVEASGQIPTGYYDSTAGKTGEQLKSALNTILNTNLTRVSYGDSRYILDETDRDPANTSNCIVVYLGTSVSGTWDDGNTWNREHVWPQSLLGVNVDNSHVGVGSDLQNLKPADPGENSSRGNKYYANQTTSASYAPRNAVKGDLARILFYMVVMYETAPLDLELVNRAPNTYEMALLDVLLEWHIQDPVDDFERNRNEVIYSYQHNRNPFIDHPEYVNLIWGGNPPPAAPSQLSAAIITDTSVTLTWTDNSTDETGFRIYQTDSLIHTTAANVKTFTVQKLLPGSAYTFGVTAWNDYGESSATTLRIVTLSDDTTSNAIFFSEYIEGISYNKALEIVNGSEIAVTLDDYSIISNANNGNWYTSHYTFPSGTILNPGEVWVIVNPSADTNLKSLANDTTNSTVVNFTGDDVRALVKISGTDTTFIDIIGAYRDSTYSTNGWAVAGISGAMKDHTLVRKPGVRRGNPDWASSAGTDAGNSEWIVYPQNTFSYLGAHSFNENAIGGGYFAQNRPEDFRLYPCYPNPFNNTTHLVFALPATYNVTVIVFDLNGRLVDERQFGQFPAGYHTIAWSGDKLSSGIYLYRMQAGQQMRTGKLLLIK